MGVQNGNNNDCTSTRAAQPFNPVGNFGTSSGLPDRFGSENHFYYLSRFAWVFYIIRFSLQWSPSSWACLRCAPALAPTCPALPCSSHASSSLFSRKRSTRSRGSFVDSESQR